MKLFEYAKGGASLRLVDSGREPFSLKELLAIRGCSVFTPTEIDGHIVYTICMDDDEILVSGLRSNAWGVNVAELYS